MTQYLPPNLLALFAPRDPIPYFAHLDVLPWEKKAWPYHGISRCAKEFEDPSETPPATRAETKEERITRKQQEREEREREKLKEQIENWDVINDPNVVGDPFKTLFVGRINYDTSESKLRREFETYGRIKHIQVMTSSGTGKPRGYAFIEYEKERDMHSAYKHADGKKIDGRRVVVDVERGRTVKSWTPRRLGGGLGGTRRGGPNENIKYSGRVDDRDVSGTGERSKEDRDRDNDRERERDRRSRERDRERPSRTRDNGRERTARSRSHSRDRKDRDRRENRDHGQDRDRDRDPGQDRDRDKDRDRDPGQDRDRDRDHGSSRKDKDWDSKDRDRERDREREKDKGKDRSKDRDKDRHRDRDRDRDRDRNRKRDREGDVRDSEGRSEKRSRVDGDRASERQGNGIDETVAKIES